MNPIKPMPTVQRLLQAPHVLVLLEVDPFIREKDIKAVQVEPHIECYLAARIAAVYQRW